MATSDRDNKKTRSPRASQTGELVGVRLQPGPLRLLDDWRRGQEDLPGRAEAIRRLIDAGLAKKAKR